MWGPERSAESCWGQGLAWPLTPTRGESPEVFYLESVHVPVIAECKVTKLTRTLPVAITLWPGRSPDLSPLGCPSAITRCCLRPEHSSKQRVFWHLPVVSLCHLRALCPLLSAPLSLFLHLCKERTFIYPPTHQRSWKVQASVST